MKAFLSNLKVRTKLSLAFGLLVLVVTLISGLSLLSLSQANARFTGYFSGADAREQMAIAIQNAAYRRAIAARNLVLVTEKEDKDSELNAVSGAHREMQEALQKLARSIDGAADVSAQDRASLAKITGIEARYGMVALAIVQMAVNGQQDAAIKKMNAECRPLLSALLTATQDYIAFGRAQIIEQERYAEAAYSRDRILLLLACVGAAMIAILLGWVVARAITVPLIHAVQLAEAVASGDLRTMITVVSEDETGQLVSSLQRMNTSLIRMVGQVRQSVDGIVTASAEIASGTQDLSVRTETQASALQQTASSMNEMTATVQNNAESARHASDLADSAAKVAEQGGEVVKSVASTMAEITHSSRKITDIISLIDGIAFQTNILSLNAAVEAARAGEQGKGFAVVASEVRSLAQRSALAAREIKTLISDSAEKVDAGSKLVVDAGSTMQEILSQVQSVNQLICGMNTSTAQQTAGISQVNQAVSSLDEGTQRNAALVEESAAAAESLKQQAADLLEVVSMFKTEAVES